MGDRKPFKISNAHRSVKKDLFAGSLEELCKMAAETFEKLSTLPTIHLDSDGTEVDDEEYFRTLELNTELIAVFPGEQWMDPTQYVSICSQSDTTDAAAETKRIDRIVDQLQDNLCNGSALTEQDLESLSNMDPNSLVDITGKDFMDQLKDSGRPMCAKRTAEDRISLLKLLKDGAIFCSERYPEEAENIEYELNRDIYGDNSPVPATPTSIPNTGITRSRSTSTTATTTTGADNRTQQNSASGFKTIEVVEMTAAETILATAATVAVVERSAIVTNEVAINSNINNNNNRSPNNNNNIKNTTAVNDV